MENISYYNHATFTKVLLSKGVYLFEIVDAKINNMEDDSKLRPSLNLTLKVLNQQHDNKKFIFKHTSLRLELWGRQVIHPKSKLVIDDDRSEKYLAARMDKDMKRIGGIALANGVQGALPKSALDYIGMKFCAIVDYEKIKKNEEQVFRNLPENSFTSESEFDKICSANEDFNKRHQPQIISESIKDANGSYKRYTHYHFGSDLQIGDEQWV